MKGMRESTENFYVPKVSWRSDESDCADRSYRAEDLIDQWQKGVMLDSDLSALYGVETKMLVRAVKRILSASLMISLQLTKEKFDNLKYHFGTSRWGGRRYLPYAFTENGVPEP
jgi:hypothetical protein